MHKTIEDFYKREIDYFLTTNRETEDADLIGHIITLRNAGRLEEAYDIIHPKDTQEE